MKRLLTSAITALIVTLTANASAENHNVFLAESRVVPAKLEWNREIAVKSPGPIYCQIENQRGMMSVTVLADRTYQAVMNGNQKGVFREDLVLTVDATKGIFEDVIQLPKSGSYWFIIANGMQTESEISIACADM